MSDEQLIARLRGWARDIQTGSTATWAMDQDLKEAADRIEALIAERDEAMQLLKTLSNMNGDLSRDLYKAKLLLAKAVEALICGRYFLAGEATREQFIKSYRTAMEKIKGESHE